MREVKAATSVDACLLAFTSKSPRRAVDNFANFFNFYKFCCLRNLNKAELYIFTPFPCTSGIFLIYCPQKTESKTNHENTPKGRLAIRENHLSEI